MDNIIQMSVQDGTLAGLLDLIGKVRSGDVVGVTVITTSYTGKVEMTTLSLPVPDSLARSA